MASKRKDQIRALLKGIETGRTFAGAVPVTSSSVSIDGIHALQKFE